MFCVQKRPGDAMTSMTEGPPPKGRPTQTIMNFTKAFGRDRSGNVLMMFGLFALPVFMAIGGAVDFGRWINARTDLRNAVDSSVLAAARALQTNGYNEAEALEVARVYLTNNTQSLLGSVGDLTTQIQFQISGNGDTVSATGDVNMGTVVLQLIGIRELPLFRGSGTDRSESKLAVGGNSGSSIEVSLMLDVTGSMGAGFGNGQKLADMQTAAKDLIDIVVWEDQSEFTARVALAPFSESINVGSALENDVMRNGEPTQKNVFTAARVNRTFNRVPACATERTTNHWDTDAAPNGNNGIPYKYMRGTRNCVPGNAEIVPLTSNKDVLKQSIDSYVASGGTAGHLGTAWAWYMLSPNWANVLPDASTPGSYELVTELGPQGQPLLRKIAVLMTDGEYNIQHCDGDSNDGFSGVFDFDVGINSNFKGNCRNKRGNSRDQARAICLRMQRAGIEVYTVGFQLPNRGDAVDTMNICASSEEHAYTASSGEELRQAFRDIALRISTIYISK